VREADFFLPRAGFFFGAIFFGAIFLAIIFFFGLAGFFANFFLRAGFLLAMRESLSPVRRRDNCGGASADCGKIQHREHRETRVRSFDRLEAKAPASG